MAVVSFAAVLIVVEAALIRTVLRWAGLAREIAPVVIGLVCPNVLLAGVQADRLFKECGLSRSGRMVEGRRPGPGPSGMADLRPVDVRAARSVSNALTLIFLGCVVLIFVIAEVVIPRNAQTGREALPWLYGVLLGCAALTYAMRCIPILRIDDRGVTAPAGFLGIRTTTIPREQIASCDLIVVRNTFGGIAISFPVMRDPEGRDRFRGLAANFATASTPSRPRRPRRTSCGSIQDTCAAGAEARGAGTFGDDRDGPPPGTAGARPQRSRGP